MGNLTQRRKEKNNAKVGREYYYCKLPEDPSKKNRLGEKQKNNQQKSNRNQRK